MGISISAGEYEEGFLVTDSLSTNFLKVGSFVLGPFVSYPLLGLIGASVLAGIVLLVLYGRVSAQDKLYQVKRNIYGAMLEAVLFRHDIKTSLAAQLRMLLGGGKYFLLAVPPLLILAVPCIIFLGQLNFYFGSRPAKVSEPLMVSLKVTNPEEVFGVELLPDDPAQLEVSNPVRVQEERETFYRLTPKASGALKLTIRNSEGEEVHDALMVSERKDGFSPFAYRSFWMSWLYPTFSELPKGVERLSVLYEPAYYTVFGMNLHWLLLFFVASLISGLLAAKVFKIEI